MFNVEKPTPENELHNFGMKVKAEKRNTRVLTEIKSLHMFLPSY